MRMYELEVLSNHRVSERYAHMVVDARHTDGRAAPGQFYYIRCGGDWNPLLRRPFSVYAVNSRENRLEFLYLVKGKGTALLSTMPAGSTLDVFGPLGNGFTLRGNEQAILLLARGVGIATLAALARQASEQGIRVVTVASARSRNDLLALDGLADIGAVVYCVTDEEGNSGVGQVRSVVSELIEQYGVEAAYTCGSRRLSRMLQSLARERNLYAEIALEEHMGCGIGVCFACVCDIVDGSGVMRSVRICREGPVFPLSQVVLDV